MMTLIDLALGGLLMVVALVFFVSGLRGFGVVRRVLARPTTPIAKIEDEGHVEVAGRVTAIGEPVLSLSGERCIAVRTIVRGRSGTGKNSSLKGEKVMTRVVPARLADGSGKACRLDLELCEIVGERWESPALPADALLGSPWAHALVPDGSTNITIEEHIIADGAAVVVAAECEPSAPLPGSGGYRDPVSPEWLLKGRPANLLVLSAGSQARLVARAAVPAAAIVLASLYLAAVGLAVAGIALAL